MSVVVMKRRFEAPPSKDEILSLLTGDNVGDKAKAKAALVNLLAPMKDLLALYQFADTLDTAAEKYAEMLKEQDGVKKSIDSLKKQTAGANDAYSAAANKLGDLEKEILALEREREDLASSIQDEETAKLRVTKTVAAEYDKLRAEMLGKVAEEEVEAKTTLKSLKADITKAQTDIDNLAEKKRQFIASLTGN